MLAPAAASLETPMICASAYGVPVLAIESSFDPRPLVCPRCGKVNAQRLMRWTFQAGNRGPPLIQPVLFLEFPRKVLLREALEILARLGVELVLEAAREHPLDLHLPGLLLEPLVVHELLGPRNVLVVELDADVPRQLVTLGIRARKADELR